ncbi:MAG: nucleoside hydrolase [Planctomycetota bacterium]
MPRKVVLDMDPGVDDAVALCLALAEPKLEVLAVTATGGNVGPERATRNVQAIVEQLDPPRLPRIGCAAPNQALRADARHIYGADGFCGAEFPVAEMVNRRPSVKVMGDEVRASPGEVTIIATGPLTNIASLLQADPDIATQIGHLIILGGADRVNGNITAAAEFNFFCDPDAAQAVMRSRVTKTMIPIDITQQLVFGYDFLERFRHSASRTGRLLEQLLPGAYRAHRQRLGLEGIYLHDVVAVVAAIHPELFTTERLHGDVETTGELTAGATIFDRRANPENPPNVDLAIEFDAASATDCVLRGLDAAG